MFIFIYYNIYISSLLCSKCYLVGVRAGLACFDRELLQILLQFYCHHPCREVQKVNYNALSHNGA